MTQFRVEPETLDLISELAQRQGEHLEAITDHLRAHATLGDVGGLVMGILGPMYHAGRDNAMEGFSQGKTVAQAVADTATESKQAYLEADDACRDGLQDAIAGSDFSDLPRRPPAGPVHLPPATMVPGTGDIAPGPGSGFVDAVDDTSAAYRDLGRGGVNPMMDRIHPRADLSPAMQRVDNFGISDYFDNQVERGVDRFWDRMDDRYGIPGATSTVRESIESQQHSAFLQSYYQGLYGDNPAPAHRANEWVDASLTPRTWQAGQDVAGLYGQVRGAYDAVGDYHATGDALESVRDVASGPDNTGTHDWAQGR